MNIVGVNFVEWQENRKKKNVFLISYICLCLRINKLKLFLPNVKLNGIFFNEIMDTYFRMNIGKGESF